MILGSNRTQTGHIYWDFSGNCRCFKYNFMWDPTMLATINIGLNNTSSSNKPHENSVHVQIPIQRKRAAGVS